jgi:hypothetical protein
VNTVNPLRCLQRGWAGAYATHAKSETAASPFGADDSIENRTNDGENFTCIGTRVLDQWAPPYR